MLIFDSLDDLQTINVYVENVDDPPTLYYPEKFDVIEDDPLTFAGLYLTDIDEFPKDANGTEVYLMVSISQLSFPTIQSSDVWMTLGNKSEATSGSNTIAFAGYIADLNEQLRTMIFANNVEGINTC